MTKHTIFVFMGLIGCSLTAGCSSSSSSGSGFTCDIKTSAYEYCEDYSNLPSADQSAVSSECTAAKGTAGTSCPTANALGSCAVSAGGISYSSTYYKSTGFTAAEAQMACTGGGGKWTAG